MAKCSVCGNPVFGVEAYYMQGNKILVVHPNCKPSKEVCCQGWERHDITCAKYGQPKS